MISQAVIWVGGTGTRLGASTEGLPKPMVPVGGRPFLDYLIDQFTRHGVREIILLASHHGKAVVEHYSTAERDDCTIEVIIEDAPTGTGGALYHAREYLNETFFLAYGASLFDFNLLDLEARSVDEPWVGKIALRSQPASSPYGRVTTMGSLVTGFIDKDSRSHGGFINTGVYILRKSILDYLHETKTRSLETEVFPGLVTQNLLRAWNYEGFFIDTGFRKDLEWTRQNFTHQLHKPAVFLDRDGVLNTNYGYVHSPENFSWVKGAPEAVKSFNDHGYLVFVVTNQSGVARGYYREESILELHAWIAAQLRTTGAHIDQFLYCPHHPEALVEEYKRDCPWRKPKPGMLHRALENWPIDRQKSFLIGDKETDIQAAAQVGIPGYLFKGGCLETFSSRILKEPKNTGCLTHPK